MPTELPITDIIQLGDLSGGLAANYVSNGALFGARVIKPTPPVQITIITDAIRWANDGGTLTTAQLRNLANYGYWMFGKFQLEAQNIINGSGGGGSVVPGGGAIPFPYDWVVDGSTSSTKPLKDGDTSVILTYFIGFNLEFTRNNLTQNTSVPQDGVSTYYGWNRVTGLFTLYNGAASTGEQMRILPTR